jgi:HD-like signal output (HDOD) protein
MARQSPAELLADPIGSQVCVQFIRSKSSNGHSMASERSVVTWLRGLFRPAPPPSNHNARRAVRASPAAVPAAAKSSSTSSASDVSWSELAPNFAPFAQALGLELRLPVTLSEAQRRQVAELAGAVSEHVANDDCGPSSLPLASLRVLHLVVRSDVEVTELASTIQTDPALTAALLRVANSPVMRASSGETDTVRDAVVRLGIAESGRVAAAVAAKTLFSPRSKSAHALFSAQFGRLHVAAASGAAGAAYLAMERGIGRSDRAYLGGMLHDVGKSLALGALAALVLARKAPRDLEPAVVTQLLEERNVELGTQAHVRWGLPAYLTELCATQHDPKVQATPAQAELHLVRVVAGLLALRDGPESLERISELVQSLSVLKLSPLQTRALDAELKTRTAQVRHHIGDGSR